MELAFLSLIEVLLAPLWVWLFLDTVGAYTLIGGAVVLLAIVGNALFGLRRKPVPVCNREGFALELRKAQQQHAQPFGARLDGHFAFIG